MRALLVLTCCSALAALLGCGKSETGEGAAPGGSSSSSAGQPAATQAGASSSAAGNAATAGSAQGGAAGSAAHGGSAPAAGGVAGSPGDAGGAAATGGVAPGQGGDEAEGGVGSSEGGASGLVDCNAVHALCRSLPPDCAAMHVPSIVGTCWGPCVRIDSCRCSSAQQCPDNNQYTCWGGEHCGPYVQ